MVTRFSNCLGYIRHHEETGSSLLSQRLLGLLLGTAKKVYWPYATCTSPIMHLICPPPKFAKALFQISLGTAVIPRRNEKQRLCKVFLLGGGGDKVHYGRCASGVFERLGIMYTSNGKRSLVPRDQVSPSFVVYCSLFELFLSAHFIFWEILNLNLTFVVCRVREA